MLKKNKFISINSEEAGPYAEDIFGMISSSYAHVGGNLRIQNADDVSNGSVTFWILKDVDKDYDPDLVIGGYETEHGIKLTILAQDGSNTAKKEAILKMISLMKTPGFYCEIDFHLAEKFDLPVIKDYDVILEILEKEIEWIGNGLYYRIIETKKCKKVLVGMPLVL